MKIVRDEIPRMHAEGRLAEHLVNGTEHRKTQAFRKAEPEEYLLLLRTKLAEETGEVLSAVRREHLLEELSDVWTVLSALVHAEGWTMEDVLSRADAKADVYGGLRQGWILMEKTP